MSENLGEGYEPKPTWQRVETWSKTVASRILSNRFFSCSQRIKDLEADITRYLSGECNCPTKEVGKPGADHFPGCPVRAAKRIEQLEADKAELVQALEDLLAKTGWNDSYFDLLVAKHTNQEKGND